MLFMTTNMTACTFETGRWREDVVTRTIACFTLGRHTVGHDHETVPFVFDGFACMTVLILRTNEIRSKGRSEFTWDWIIEFDIVVDELLSNV